MTIRSDKENVDTALKDLNYSDYLLNTSKVKYGRKSDISYHKYYISKYDKIFIMKKFFT